MQSTAKTVTAYLEELPEDRRKVIAKVRGVVKKHLPKGYVETMAWGGICWIVPLKVCPNTYNGQPLAYAGLGSQKHYNSLHLLGVYYDRPLKRKLEAGFKAAGKKLDMGKSCVRFKKLEDLPLDVIGDIVASVPVKRYIEMNRSVHGDGKR